MLTPSGEVLGFQPRARRGVVIQTLVGLEPSGGGCIGSLDGILDVHLPPPQRLRRMALAISFNGILPKDERVLY